MDNKIKKRGADKLNQEKCQNFKSVSQSLNKDKVYKCSVREAVLVSNKDLSFCNHEYLYSNPCKAV